MANGRVEMGVGEVKRQIRQNTGVRIADDTPLLSWLPRFGAPVMNKMRVGTNGKTSEMRRTGPKMEKANGAIWREIVVP